MTFDNKREVRWWEAVGVGLALAVAALALLQWGIEGVIHDRKTQTMPELKGKSIAAALDQLAPLNIGLRKEGAEFNDAVPMASVLRQYPPAGTVVREGKIVRVVVSQGGETVLTPAIVGLPLRNGEMLLRQSQLVLGEVNESYSLKFEKGTVLSQDPKAEASVERNALVNVTVSGGPPPAGVDLMPDFLRKNISEVQAWANSAGTTLSSSKDMSSPFAYGTVLSQDPAPDTALGASAKVSVVISGKPGKPGETGPAVTNFHYELPRGGGESLVRIVVSDKYGERELFNGLRRPGSKIDLPVQETGGAHVRIFLNGILVDERDM
ncbi:MAG: PASTA domain-containing protein [Elusimicrobia bacterium]|nr:PASTA domain-containing protein [Elusimicrobiota bacterium]